MKVSFIGLGIMGSRMAKNLLKNGVDLTVYNRTIETAKPLEAEGATIASSIADCVKDADIVFTMLSTPQVVEQVAFGDGGLIDNMKANALWVDCTTVDPIYSKQTAQKVIERGFRFLGAPVAGSKNQAEAGVLVFFVGGAVEDVEQVQPLLEYMGKKVAHFGGAGNGAAYKMLVNNLLAQSMVAFAETYQLGIKMGLDKEALLNSLPSLVVTAPFIQFKADNIRTGQYDVEFPLEWMHKDVHLAAQMGYAFDSPMYLANVTAALYASAKQHGLGREDFSAITKYLG